MNTLEQERKMAEQIRSQYVDKKASKLEELRKLDEKASRPANIFAFTFGTVGALILGLGMSLSMKVIGNFMPLGIVIGILGIAMVTVNSFIYKAINKKNKKKYEKQIFALSDEILNETK